MANPDNISESQLVSRALDLLLSMSEDGLKSNVAKVRQAIQTLQQRIEGCTTPRSPCQRQLFTNLNHGSVVHVPEKYSGGQGLVPASKRRSLLPKRDHYPKTYPSGEAAVPRRVDHQKSTTNHDRSPPRQSPDDSSSGHLETLIQNLERELPAIRNFVDEFDPATADLQQQTAFCDLRIADIVHANGTLPGDESYRLVQLRRLLSQRSLAFEHEKWENTVSKGPKHISSLQRKRIAIENLPSGNSRTCYQPEFLELLGGTHLESVKKAIEHGIKLRCIEDMLCNVGGPGFSAILLWRYTDLRMVQYKDVGKLVKAFQGCPAIRDVAVKSRDWLLQWQVRYDELCHKSKPVLGTGTNTVVHPLRKRPIASTSPDLNKRARCSAESMMQSGSNLHLNSALSIDPHTCGDDVNLSNSIEDEPAQLSHQELMSQSIEEYDPVQVEDQQRISSGYSPPVPGGDTHQGYASTGSNIVVDGLANAFSRQPMTSIGPAKDVEQGNLNQGLQRDTELNQTSAFETGYTWNPTQEPECIIPANTFVDILPNTHFSEGFEFHTGDMTSSFPVWDSLCP